jgi:3-oxoacyl-[acyl-carrier-protein] synthase-3
MYSDTALPVEIAGLGAYLPQRVLSNADLESMVDTSNQWIVQRTGIRERRIAANDQATSDLAIGAARQALAAASVGAAELDAVLVATCTPDYVFPATACLVQAALGASHAMAFDLEAACSGFLFGFACGASMLAAGIARNILVVGTECLSRITDYTDRTTCILFGDAAGAALLRPAANGGQLLYCHMGADGSQPDMLMVPAGGSRLPACAASVAQRAHYMRLQGREVFKQAVGKLAKMLQAVPERTGIQLDQIGLVIPHQSNVRIIRSAFERVGMDLSKAYMNIDRVGNTSAASIPLAMAQAEEQGMLRRGELVLLLAFGGGLTWGSALIRY